MEEIRNIVNLLALFGVPSLCACAVYFAKACIRFGKKQDILANAIQKMMRRDLTQDFHKYMKQGYSEELATKAAEAMYDGDTDALFNVQTEATTAIIKKKESEWLKSRPDVNAGTGTQGVTKEQFETMNMMQRSELRKKSPEVYERLVGRA